MSEQTNDQQVNEVNIGDLQAQISSLKSNKDAALSEKKKLAEQNSALQKLVDSVGGSEGIQKLIELREKSQDEHQKNLLAQGKYEDVIQNTTNQLKVQYESQIKSLNDEYDVVSKQSEAYRNKYREKLVADKVLATSRELELQDTAYKDITLHVLHDFTFDENDNPVIVEDGIKKVNSKGEIYGVVDYINDKRKEYPHWNKPVKSGFTNGALSGSSTTTDYSRMSNNDIMRDRAARRLKR